MFRISSESSGLKHTAVGSFIVILTQSAVLGIRAAQLGLLENRRRSVYTVDMAARHRRGAQQKFLPQLASAWPKRTGVYTVDVDRTTATSQSKSELSSNKKK